MQKIEVSITRVNKIDDPETVRDAVRDSIDLAGGLEYAFRRTDRVLIKPNVLMPMDYKSGGITNPAVVEAVIVLLKDFGIKKITIGEGSVVGENSMRSLALCGLDKIAEKEQVKLIDLKKDTFIPMGISNGKVFRILKIPREVAEADAIINIPVLKTHDMFPVSLGLKNMKGVIHENDKQRFHSLDLAQCIVDLNKLVLPRLTVIDGTIGMEGLGPVYGSPANMGIIITSYDTVAADSVGSAVMGIDPMETSYIKLASEQGLGESDISKIDVRGATIKEVRKNFKRINLEDVLKYPEFKNCGITITDRGACSGCRAVITSLISDAIKSGRTGRLKNVSFLMGQMLKPKDLKNAEAKTVFFGRCTRKYRKREGIYLNGCPPHILNVKKALGYTAGDFGDFSFMRTHLEKFGFKDE